MSRHGSGRRLSYYALSSARLTRVMTVRTPALSVVIPLYNKMPYL